MTNVRIVRTMYRYLLHHVTADDARRFLEAIGVDERYLADENNWLPLETYTRAHQRLREITGDPAIGFKLGRFTISPQNLGSVWTLARAAAYLGGGTAAGFRIVPRLTNQITRLGTLELEHLDRTSARIRWRQRKPETFHEFQCLYRQGLFTAAPRMGDLPPAVVEERACIGRGDDACVYDVQFGRDRVVAGVVWGAAIGVAGAVLGLAVGLGWVEAGAILVVAVALGFARDRADQLTWNMSVMTEQYDALVEAKTRLQEDYDLLQRTQRELREKERLASLGELSARVAHELRNPLGVIKAAAQVLADPARAQAVREEVTSFIVEEADRMNASITNFLVFARPKVSHRTPTDVAAAAERLVLEWDTHPDTKVRIALHVDGTLPRVLVDPHQLHQVLLNLILNASEAMRGEGEIRIDAGTVDGRVVLAVEDDGPGFSEEAAARAFEPFFTTKEYGTGLGLTNVKQMVEANGGTLEVGRGGGGGARIAVSLEPAADAG